jgi:hypothetical protein
MRKAACYMCEEKTDRGVQILVDRISPDHSHVKNFACALCERCETALKLGTIYVELHRLVDSTKESYTR